MTTDTPIQVISQIAPEDVGAMAELLMETITARNGKEQLPNKMMMAREAKDHFNLPSQPAIDLVTAMIEKYRPDLIALGYHPTKFVLQPPKYKG